jgi:hypothetical protein
MIANGIIQRGIRVKWEAFARFDRQLTASVCKTLSRSGCIGLMIGLESGSQRIEDLMNKGHRVEELPKILRNLHRAGIYTSLGVIVGFPSETEDEYMETVHFLKSNSKYISNAGLSTFGLNYHSDVFNHPRKYGIKGIKETENLFFSRNFQYEIDCGITNQQAHHYADQFRFNIWDRLMEKATRRAFRMLQRFRLIVE